MCPTMAYNVFGLGEGGDINHKCLCGELILNIAVNVKRSNAPPLLPSVCYALFFSLGISQLKIIYRKMYFYLAVNTESCIFVPYKTR